MRDYVCPKIMVSPPHFVMSWCWWDNCLWSFLFLHLFSLAALRFGLFGVFWDPPFPPSTHHQVTIDLVLPREAKRRWTRQSFVGVWLDREVSGRPNVGLALILFIQNCGDIIRFLFFFVVLVLFFYSHNRKLRCYYWYTYCFVAGSVENNSLFLITAF